MLRPIFAEGKQLSAKGAVEISLPEDDAAAMIIICNILHLRHKEIPQKPPVDQIYQVAVLADKYNCSAALKTTVAHWFDSRQARMFASETVIAFASACILRQREAHRRLGEQLIMDHRHSDGPIKIELGGTAVVQGPAAQELAVVIGT